MFFFVFWDPERLAPHAASDDDVQICLAGKRAVVVEDQMAFQMIVSKLLTDAGVDVAGKASDGREAVEVIRDVRPDIVLMDTMMPLMDGLDAAERVLAEQQPCIVLLSASQSKEHQRRARELGLGFIPKPIDKNTFVDQVTAAYRRHARAATR